MKLVSKAESKNFQKYIFLDFIPDSINLFKSQSRSAHSAKAALSKKRSKKPTEDLFYYIILQKLLSQQIKSEVKTFKLNI